MSWIKYMIKSIPIITCAYLLLITTVQAEKLPVAVALYPQCPLSLQLDGQSYALENEHIYAGPVEDRATLKPEPIPDKEGIEPSFWEHRGASSKYPFYLKCIYQNTPHYLVLNLRGARRCTSTQADTRMKCE